MRMLLWPRSTTTLSPRTAWVHLQRKQHDPHGSFTAPACELRRTSSASCVRISAIRSSSPSEVRPSSSNRSVTAHSASATLCLDSAGSVSNIAMVYSSRQGGHFDSLFDSPDFIFLHLSFIRLGWRRQDRLAAKRISAACGNISRPRTRRAAGY
jgi:hypothetical protein